MNQHQDRPLSQSHKGYAPSNLLKPVMPIVRRGEAGQAVIEYILLVAISIVIIVSLSVQVFRPVRDWVNQYLGAYVQCLLDAGELPSLGDASGNSQCEGQFESFSFLSGRPSKQNPNASSGTAPLSSGSVQSNSNPASASAAERARLAGSGRGRGGGGRGAADARGGRGAAGEQAIPSPQESSQMMSGNSSGALGTSSGGARASFAESNEALQDQAKKRKQKQGKAAVSSGESVEGDGSAGRKPFLAKSPERKLEDTDAKVEPWSFGKLLRIAIIVMIIVALLLFMALQARQIQKSLEKGGD